MKKIGFIGRPSSGKTTISRGVSAKLKYLNYKVELIDEYARFFVSNFGKTSVSDQYFIINKQIEKEKEALSNECQFIISDSPIFLGEIYSILATDFKSKKDILYYHEIHSLIISKITSYDFLFYCKPSKIQNDKTLKDGKRIHTEENILIKIDEMINSFLKLYNIDYLCISGTLDEKISNVINNVI